MVLSDSEKLNRRLVPDKEDVVVITVIRKHATA